MPNGSQVAQWSAYAKPGVYTTTLAPPEEAQFEQWVKTNKIPWQDSPTSDYDMRGYWKAQQAGNLRAKTEINPLDKKPHYPDTWKTPYHKTFSRESQYALPTAGHWEGQTFMPPTPTPSGPQIEVYSPDGKFGTIPVWQLDKAKAVGYKSKDDFVEVVHPKTGQTGIVPKTQWGDEKTPGIAQTQGYVMSPREQQREKTKTAESKMQPSYAAMALAHSPTGADPQNPGNPNLSAIPESERKNVINRALATQASVLGTQGASAVAGKLLTPTVSSEIVGTGILGPGGEEIMREGLKYGPSAAAKALSNPMAKQILQWVGKGVGLTAAWKAIDALGFLNTKTPRGPIVP